MNSQRAQPQVLRSLQGKGVGLIRAVKCLCLVSENCDHGFLLWADLGLFNLSLHSDVSDGTPLHPFVDLDMKVPK